MSNREEEKIIECSNISTAIRRAKKYLEKKVIKNGIYENFGQGEVSRISDNFIDISDYSDEMNRRRRLLDCFNEWCMTYSYSKDGLKFM